MEESSEFLLHNPHWTQHRLEKRHFFESVFATRAERLLLEINEKSTLNNAILEVIKLETHIKIQGRYRTAGTSLWRIRTASYRMI